MNYVSILLILTYLFMICSCDTETEDVSDVLSTIDPLVDELSFGCPPPSIRFSRFRTENPTQAPIVTLETTPVFLSENVGSENFDSIGHLDMSSIHNKQEQLQNSKGDLSNRKTRYTDNINSYLWDDQIKNLRSNNNTDNNSNTKRSRRSVSKQLKEKKILNEELSQNVKGDTGENKFLLRQKRKSGKTTGALSRPKADSGSSKSASSSRKVSSGNYDEGDGGVLPHPDEESSSSESHEEDESSEEINFREVNEVRFPGEIGPMGDRRLCKIKCIKGKWIGPLCATTIEEDGTGNMNFQPLYKSCYIDRISPHLMLSYKNVSVSVGWVLPHGHSLQARCTEIGIYKLLGDSRVLCTNGNIDRMPSCVPTTVLTNFSDDSPPSIEIKIGTGSGAVEPSGVLAILPASTLYLDCIYPQRRGKPEWLSTPWFRTYVTGWSEVVEEKATRFRLTIKDTQSQDSGTFTCTSPRGLTNSIVIAVTVSQCPAVPDVHYPLSLQLEGNKLGQRVLYSCPLGYNLRGTANSTCLASGNWSSPPPQCQPIQCPTLILEDPHLTLVELNASAWGRAVFSCSWGYKLNGPPGVECEPGGVWSGPVPRCRAIQCPQPLVPINGQIDGASSVSNLSGPRRYAVGALVTFSCSEGHLLVGEASIVCTETGFWSHPPPFCKSQCSYPGDPPNGLIAPLKFHYDPGDTLSVQCRPGFVQYSVTGTIQRPTCLSDGNWSAPVPQCKNYEEI